MLPIDYLHCVWDIFLYEGKGLSSYFRLHSHKACRCRLPLSSRPHDFRVHSVPPYGGEPRKSSIPKPHESSTYHLPSDNQRFHLLSIFDETQGQPAKMRLGQVPHTNAVVGSPRIAAGLSSPRNDFYYLLPSQPLSYSMVVFPQGSTSASYFPLSNLSPGKPKPPYHQSTPLKQ